MEGGENGWTAAEAGPPGASTKKDYHSLLFDIICELPCVYPHKTILENMVALADRASEIFPFGSFQSCENLAEAKKEVTEILRKEVSEALK